MSEPDFWITVAEDLWIYIQVIGKQQCLLNNFHISFSDSNKSFVTIVMYKMRAQPFKLYWQNILSQRVHHVQHGVMMSAFQTSVACMSITVHCLAGFYTSDLKCPGDSNLMFGLIDC